MSRVPVGVLISGRGSNLQALLDASADPDFPAQVVVVSNRRGVAGLDRARGVDRRPQSQEGARVRR